MSHRGCYDDYDEHELDYRGRGRYDGVSENESLPTTRYMYHTFVKASLHVLFVYPSFTFKLHARSARLAATIYA
jgi:hypothetical protein